MKLLHANDKRGQHAASWYEATCATPTRPTLETEITHDVCVIGAGFTGLSAALELAKNGTSVAVLDAHRVGWGASGRNGGQLGSGFNQDQRSLQESLGLENARTLWRFSEEAKQFVHDLSAEHHFDVEYKPGIVSALHKAKFLPHLQEYCQFMQKEYHYDALEALDRNALNERVRSDDYHGGAIDHGAGHIHPLKFALGMASAAEKSGASIFEMSEVTRIEPLQQSSGYRVVTSQGSVLCEKIVLATNGYLDDLKPEVNRWIMPINNFIVVTEPLGDLATQLLPQDNAIADSRFVVNYYRRVDNDRLLFGGGENYSYRFPDSIDGIVRKAMLGIFPELEQAKIDYAWGGTLAITRSRLPYASELSKGVYTAGGFSGHGVALAGFYGRSIAKHIQGDTESFDLLSTLPTKPFPGGAALRPALLAVAMTGYSWLDKI